MGDEFIDLAGGWQVLGRDGEVRDTLILPFAWNGGEKRLVLARVFTLPQRLGDRSWRFTVDGTAERISVNLNGVNIDTRSPAGASFQVEINRRLLKFGGMPNRMVLTIARSASANGSATPRTTIYSRKRYGGIFHGIYLTAAPPVRVSDVVARVYTDSRGLGDSIRVEAWFRDDRRVDEAEEDSAGRYRCSLTLFDPAGSPVARTPPAVIYFRKDKEHKRLFEMPLPTAWREPRHSAPQLFRAQVSLSGAGNAHIVGAAFSARRLSLRSDGFYIEGAAHRLRCIAYLNTTPAVGPMLDQDRLEDDVALMKELGVDAIRLVQGTAPPQLLDICDRRGIFVFEELPVFQVPDRVLADEDFVRTTADRLRMVVARDRRYSCIAAWGVGSEINPPNDVNRRFYDRMTAIVHQLDDRPVFAVFPFAPNFSAAPLDLAVLELAPYSPWADLPLPKDVVVDRPAMLGGIRRMVVPGRLGGWVDPVSEAGQANYVVERVREAEGLGWCAGVIVGDFADWRGEVPTITGPLKGACDLYTTGLTSADREPRLAFYSLKRYWNSGIVEPLDRGTVSRSDTPLMLLVGLGLMFVLVVSARRNNLFRLNLQRTFTSPRGFFQEIHERRYLQVGHTVLLAFLISGGIALTGNGWLQSNRGSYALDWVVGYLVGADAPIRWTATLIWHPERGLLFIWAVAFLLLWLGAVQSLVITRLLGVKSTLSQNFDHLTWSSAAMLGLLPVGSVANRLYGGVEGWMVTAVALALLFWSAVRLIAVFRRHTKRSLGAVLLLWMAPPAVAMTVWVFILQYTRDIFSYWDFFWGTIVGS